MGSVEVLGLLIGLVLLIVLTMQGLSILLAAPLAAIFVAVTNGLPILQTLTEPFMKGFTDYFFKFFLIFLLGAIFGKMMEDTGGAEAVARWISRRVGKEWAVLAVVLAAAILTYGGVSLFVVGFSLYPLAVSLFRAADLPRRFIPGAMAFGSVTFTMTSPGSPEIQNLIPTKYLETTPTAGLTVGAITALTMFVMGQFCLERHIRGAKAKGEKFLPRPDDAVIIEKELPPLISAILPLAVVVFTLDVLGWDILVSLASGITLGVILMFRHYQGLVRLADSFGIAAQSAVLAACNTSAVVGFGVAASKAPAFHSMVEAVVGMPGPPLLSAAISVSLLAGMAGSASGGQGIALPILAPYYRELGVAMPALHRVVAIASGALDTLPHNGYAITTIRVICGETHRSAYMPVFWTTVVIPTIGTLLAVALFSLFPALQYR